MKNKIKAMLEEKLDEVFCEMQKEMGIESGDIEPLMLKQIDEELNCLTEMIRDVLGMQSAITEDKVKEWCSYHNGTLIDMRGNGFTYQTDGTWWFVPYGEM